MRGWPESWIETYDRFEQYIRLKREIWPRSHLEISENGDVTHALSFLPMTGKSSPLTTEVYELGASGCGWQLSRNLKKTDNFNQSGRGLQLAPGIYSAQVKSLGALGFQHHEPMIWFEIKEREDNPRKQQYTYINLEYDPNDDSRIPNYRLFNFKDFHVFTQRRNPQKIFKENQLMNPAIELNLVKGGIVERTKPEGIDLEPELYWMVYKDRHLLGKFNGTGSVNFRTSSGTGSYDVFIVVDGPNGWIPVSNILRFPIFQSDEIQATPFPEDLNRNAIPDVIEEIGIKREKGKQLTSNEKQMLQLWQTWSYHLTTTMDSGLGTNPLVREALGKHLMSN